MSTSNKDLIDGIRKDDLEKVREAVLDHGANVNYIDSGSPILVYAVGRGNTPIIEFLIKQGADINLKDRFGKSALDYGKLKGIGEYLSSTAWNVKLENSKSPTAKPIPVTPPETIDKDSRLFGALCYIIGLIIPLYILFTEKKNDKFLVFHAYQSLFLSVAAFIVSVALAILSIISSVLGPLACVVGVASIVVWVGLFCTWIYTAYKAWNGEKYLLPVVGQLAQKQV